MKNINVRLRAWSLEAVGYTNITAFNTNTNGEIVTVDVKLPNKSFPNQPEDLYDIERWTGEFEKGSGSNKSIYEHDILLYVYPGKEKNTSTVFVGAVIEEDNQWVVTDGLTKATPLHKIMSTNDSLVDVVSNLHEAVETLYEDRVDEYLVELEKDTPIEYFIEPTIKQCREAIHKELSPYMKK
ncbi:hypothetical protein ESZ50_10295 [Weissella muntiaci]|uniref:Uncharacterized protein n=1 Tax=Weissella muntiaci TaxID=2508881 RepID=A0A6C2C2T1_9LACO|nr:hypothetical protein [Weissella muntiaci]TYC48009.1 hypothetical protein ESZ50_10295 [Weissella muntiaci]